MASLNVESLFFNIPLEETIDNIIKDLFLTTDKIHNFEREELKQLTFAAYEYFFIFDGEYYTQIDGLLLWDPYWAQDLLMPFCVILRKSCFQNAL